MAYKKFYPYLYNGYYEDANKAVKRRNFLKKIDDFVNQKQYVKITLLNWAEEPIKSIEGDLTSGTITKDGASAVRRTCQLSAVVDTGSYSVDDMEMDFAINKKVFVEIGIKNYTDEYLDYPILWFPQGVFLISTFSASTSATSALNISVSLKDKMSLLNGECGGTFPATTILDEQDTQDDAGKFVTEKILVYRIIQEVVNHFGSEDLDNIIIEDVPTRIKRVVRWTGDSPLYLIRQVDENGIPYDKEYYMPTIDKPAELSAYDKTIQQYDDAGYVMDDFVYDTELTVNAGTTVTSVLDTIKNYLGNYEYFYDEYGYFHFREIKNYLNTTQGKVMTTDMTANDYLVDTTIPKEVYTFSDNSNLLSVSTSPNYSGIKNDFIINGKRKATGSDISYDVRYHLAIDTKPDVGTVYEGVLIYNELETNTQKAFFPIEADPLPSFGDMNMVYYVPSEKKAYVWVDDVWKEVTVVSYGSYLVEDWRTELYMRGLAAMKNGTDQGYYFAELQDAWPQIYDLQNHRFYGEDEDATLRSRVLTDGNYFLDFIDSSSALGQYSVSNIGRRSDVVVDDDINCLFEPEIPNIVFLNTDDQQNMTDQQWAQYKSECIDAGQPYAQVRGDIYGAFATGGYHNDAYSQICFELVTHTIYSTSVSVTALPVFYLEPNSRVKLNDNSTRTYGDFMVGSITIPLGAGSSMSASLTQCIEKM